LATGTSNSSPAGSVNALRWPAPSRRDRVCCYSMSHCPRSTRPCGDELRSELAALLRELAVTAVFVTHDQAEAMAVADRIAVMEAGRILQIDTPQALYHAPNQGFVARFIGGANRLDGQSKARTLTLPGGTLTLPRGLKPGERAYARAEAISLGPASKSKLRGKVTGVIFQGTHHRVDIAGVTNGIVTVDVAGSQAPGIGETVGLKIPTESIMMLPEDDGGIA
jgi:putative spermidine/putrescine transport system ATP-binding protein